RSRSPTCNVSNFSSGQCPRLWDCWSAVTGLEAERPERAELFLGDRSRSCPCLRRPVAGAAARRGSGVVVPAAVCGTRRPRAAARGGQRPDRVRRPRGRRTAVAAVRSPSGRGAGRGGGRSAGTGPCGRATVAAAAGGPGCGGCPRGDRGFVAVGGAVARRLAAGAHRVHVAAAWGGRRVPAPGCAWRGGGVAGGGGAVGGPGCEAAQVGRAGGAALASWRGRAAGGGGGGWAEGDVGGSCDRGRDLFSDQRLRRRGWEAGLDGGVAQRGGREANSPGGRWGQGQPQRAARELLPDGPWPGAEIRRG